MLGVVIDLFLSIQFYARVRQIKHAPMAVVPAPLNHSQFKDGE
jgi:hypothetical protein